VALRLLLAGPAQQQYRALRRRAGHHRREPRLLFPPSLPVIIYGYVASVDITRSTSPGSPGLIDVFMVAIFCIWVAWQEGAAHALRPAGGGGGRSSAPCPKAIHPIACSA